MIYNFLFDMVDVVVINPFASDNFIFVPYDRKTVTDLESLRNKITW